MTSRLAADAAPRPPSPARAPAAARTRAPRSDGEQSRERLLTTALALFAQRGYAKTSTREIAEAAGTNLAAISYYFGDKAGLYRAVFVEPAGAPGAEIAHLRDASLPLADALRAFYAGAFVAPLRQGDVARQCVKLHMREMLEPTGLWAEEIERSIRPQHAAMIALLCRHLGIRRADDDVQRLAMSLFAIGVHLHVGRDVMDQLAPRLNSAPRALDLWLDRLVMYGVAMVEAERARRPGAAR